MAVQHDTGGRRELWPAGGRPSTARRPRSRLLVFAAIATALATVGAACSRGSGSSARPVASQPAVTGVGDASGLVVTIDRNKTFQRIDGFGTSVRLFDDPHLTNTFDKTTARSAVVVSPDAQRAVLDALYRDLGITRLRPATSAGIMPTPESTPDYSWKLNDGYVDFAKKVGALGARTVFLSPIILEPWMRHDHPEDYVTWAEAIIRRWADLGVPISYYSVVNEPGNFASGGWSGEYLRDVIKLLGPRLRADHLDAKFVVPDDLNPGKALVRLKVVLADPEARAYVGALAYHLYDDRDGIAEIRQLGEQYGLPVWMTEFYESDPWAWAQTMHTLLTEGGVSAIDYLWGFFGQWRSPGEQLITLRSDAQNRYTGFERSKQYYVVGQFSRFVHPGARRVDALVSDPSVQVTAFEDGSSLVVVVIADGQHGPHANVRFVTGVGSARVQATRTSATEDWAQLPEIKASNGTFSASLPPESVTTFVVRSTP